MNKTCVLGSFDNLQSRHVRLLEEAARLGPVHVLLLSDRSVAELTGRPPVFPEEERRYFVQALRYVDRLSLIKQWADGYALPLEFIERPVTWVVDQSDDRPARSAFCRAHDLSYVVIPETSLLEFPAADLRATATTSASTPSARRKKVLVTGCYDWLHTGHVRFFEEVAELGELYVIVGHDANITLLKGPGHPLFGQLHRRYMVGAIRYVHEARVATGSGWLDAEPEIREIKPDMYVVNEDGDRPEKRDFCRAHGIEYRVLVRTPKAGLPRRESTALRGF